MLRISVDENEMFYVYATAHPLEAMRAELAAVAMCSHQRGCIGLVVNDNGCRNFNELLAIAEKYNERVKILWD